MPAKGLNKESSSATKVQNNPRRCIITTPRRRVSHIATHRDTQLGTCPSETPIRDLRPATATRTGRLLLSWFGQGVETSPSQAEQSHVKTRSRRTRWLRKIRRYGGSPRCSNGPAAQGHSCSVGKAQVSEAATSDTVTNQ